MPRPSAMLTVRERRTISSSGSAGPVGERRSSGLQIRLRRFESGPGLQKRWCAAENQVNASGSTEPGASLPRSRVPSPARPAIPAETGNQARHVCMRPQARRVANRVAARSVHAPANEIRFSRTRQDRRRTNAIGRRNRLPTALFRRMAALEIGSKWRLRTLRPEIPRREGSEVLPVPRTAVSAACAGSSRRPSQRRRSGCVRSSCREPRRAGR